MAKGKLILICQFGGEFGKIDDGTLRYSGGDAHAVNVNSETLFGDLKLKLAQMCDLDYETVSIKYFLPKNTRTLISLSNDKDLKRMLDFHAISVTADVYVLGKKGFNHSALEINTNRESGIKVAEFVNHAFAQPATTPPVDAAGPVCTSSSHGRTKRSAAQKKSNPPDIDSVIGLDESPRSPITGNSLSNDSACGGTDDSVSAPLMKATGQSSTNIDTSASPADTVKKRRRVASWKLGANGPTIVSVPDDIEDKRSQKKNRQVLVPDDDIENKKDDIIEKEDRPNTSRLTNSDEVSLEKLIASWREGITGIGQDFKNVYEFRDALQKYAMAHRFVYRLKKNDSNRASGICVAEGCPWKIHASWVPVAHSFRIKKFNDSHTCEGKSWKSAHPTKNWLVNIIKERLRDSPHHKPKDIANTILRDFGVELNYTQVWRGIEDARQQLQGSYKEAYSQLPWYCEKIMVTNPGSLAKLLNGDDQRFQCLSVSLNASINGFQKGCRPLLFLEATSLKSKYQEVLLTATALDGDEGFLPVAFAIVDSENNDKWNWFLEQLKSVLTDVGSITFICDREKGLKETVRKVFPDSYQGYTMYHLLESFKKSLKGPFHGEGKASLPGYFIAAAHAVRIVAYKRFTEQIKHVSSQAYDWVMQIEPECWTTINSKGERHNQITENIAELYINLVEELKELPITKKILAIIHMMTAIINTRQAESSKWSTKLTPSKNEKLHEEIVDARGLKVLISSDTLFEVRDEVTHVVNLDKSECTCLGWQTTGLPCRHAIAVFNIKRKNMYDYCSKYFTVDSFRLTYSESISHVPGEGYMAGKEDTSSGSAPLLPPIPSTSVNQPKVKDSKREGPTKRVSSRSRCKEEEQNNASSEAAS